MIFSGPLIKTVQVTLDGTLLPNVNVLNHGQVIDIFERHFIAITAASSAKLRKWLDHPMSLVKHSQMLHPIRQYITVFNTLYCIRESHKSKVKVQV